MEEKNFSVIKDLKGYFEEGQRKAIYLMPSGEGLVNLVFGIMSLVGVILVNK